MKDKIFQSADDEEEDEEGEKNNSEDSTNIDHYTYYFEDFQN